MNPVEVVEGSSPVVLGFPHTGTHVPPEMFERLTPLGQTLSDTDRHVDRLYADLLPGATTVRATFHRYVIDANRDPSGASLYPGQNTTGLCPLVGFDGRALYLEGQQPDEAEQQGRVEAYWRPYHQALAAELTRLRQFHDRVLLWEGHSIRSVCPMFFEGTLSDFNLGTADGASASGQLLAKLCAELDQQDGYRWVANGRFKGGYITRQYGQPETGIHAVQMEMTQACYMDERPPFPWDAERAAPAQQVVAKLLEVALGWISESAG